MESTIVAQDGVVLSVENHRIHSPRARVVIVHGYAEHRRRYAGVVADLMRSGLECHLLDLRGHGRSGGRAAHVGRFSDYIDDLDCFLSHVRGLTGPPRPLFLLAHSLGGLIAMAHALRAPAVVDGLALSSPFLRRAFPLKPGAELLAAVAARVTPVFPFASPIEPQWLSHDPAVVADYGEDPLVRRTATARWFIEVARAQRVVRSDARNIRLPVFMMLGGDDRIADPRTSQDVFAIIRSSDKTLRLYPGFRHEVLNEKDRNLVVSDLTDWLLSRAWPSPTR